MHYYKGSLSKLPYICSTWAPKVDNFMTPWNININSYGSCKSSFDDSFALFQICWLAGLNKNPQKCSHQMAQKMVKLTKI